MTNKTMHIAAISGSLKSTSSNTNILRAIARLAPENVAIKIIEGIDTLPHFSPDREEDIASVNNFRQQIKAADGVIISTPEYAFGIQAY